MGHRMPLIGLILYSTVGWLIVIVTGSRFVQLLRRRLRLRRWRVAEAVVEDVRLERPLGYADHLMVRYRYQDSDFDWLRRKPVRQPEHAGHRRPDPGALRPAHAPPFGERPGGPNGWRMLAYAAVCAMVLAATVAAIVLSR